MRRIILSESELHSLLERVVNEAIDKVQNWTGDGYVGIDDEGNATNYLPDENP